MKIEPSKSKIPKGKKEEDTKKVGIPAVKPKSKIRKGKNKKDKKGVGIPDGPNKNFEKHGTGILPVGIPDGPSKRKDGKVDIKIEE